MKHRLPQNTQFQAYWRMLESSGRDFTSPDDDLTSEESLEDASDEKDEDDKSSSDSDEDSDEEDNVNGTGNGNETGGDDSAIGVGEMDVKIDGEGLSETEKRYKNNQNIKIEHKCKQEHNPFQDRCKKRVPIINAGDISDLQLDQPSTRDNSNKDSRSVDNNSVSN